MPNQLFLPLLGEESLAILWDHFPEPQRDQLIVLFAQLIARAVRNKPSGRKESDHDPDPSRDAGQDPSRTSGP